MSYTYADYRESADSLRSILGDFSPEVLLILGSGLGFLGDTVETPVFVDYGTIPHFKPSTAPDHKGRFVFGTLRGRRVAVMQGRMHCYEGYSMEDAAYPVRVLRLLGAEKLILLTDIEGLCNSIELRDVISYLNIGDVPMLKDKGVIAGGMIPKVDCCVTAIEEGVTNVHIIDGRKPHSILYEAFTDENIGTTIGKDQPSKGIK